MLVSEGAVRGGVRFTGAASVIGFYRDLALTGFVDVTVDELGVPWGLARNSSSGFHSSPHILAQAPSHLPFPTRTCRVAFRIWVGREKVQRVGRETRASARCPRVERTTTECTSPP